MGLPVRYSNCSRGFAGKPPKCYQWFDVEHPRSPGPRRRLNRTSRRPSPPPRRRPRRLRACSACLRGRSRRPSRRPLPRQRILLRRSRSGDEFQRISARRRRRRPYRSRARGRRQRRFLHGGADTTGASPGTVYADPYGHVLMLVRRVPEVNGTPGVFLAVDAEPDGSITRKRFWRGNFLFVHEPSLGSPGFKHFRPIMREKKRSVAAAEQHGNRQESAIRHSHPSSRKWPWRILRSHG